MVKVIRRLCVSWLGNVTLHKIFSNSERLARHAGAVLKCQIDRWSCVPPPKVGAAHSSPPKYPPPPRRVENFWEQEF